MRATSDFPKSEAMAFAMDVFPEPVPPAIPMRIAYLSIIQKDRVINLKLFEYHNYLNLLQYRAGYYQQIHE